MFVRHLDLKLLMITKKKKEYFKKRIFKKTKGNKGYIYCVNTQKYFNFIKQELKKDPHFP